MTFIFNNYYLYQLNDLIMACLQNPPRSNRMFSAFGILNAQCSNVVLINPVPHVLHCPFSMLLCSRNHGGGWFMSRFSATQISYSYRSIPCQDAATIGWQLLTNLINSTIFSSVSIHLCFALSSPPIFIHHYTFKAPSDFFFFFFS